MNIWLIKVGEVLPLESDSRKMRTVLLAESLVERRHDVLWWTSAFDHFKKKWIFRTDTELNVKSNKIDPSDVETLKTMKVDTRFSSMTYEDLAVNYSEVILSF